MKQHQVLAIEKGIKTKAEQALTAAYHNAQKPALFFGMERRYEPKDDDGERLPSEVQQIQVRLSDMLASVSEVVSEHVDMMATKDATNQVAKAALVVGGKSFDLPVETLLGLEKQLRNIKTFVEAIPTLPTADNWTFSDAKGLYESAEVDANRTKKVQRPLVLYPATPEHPAQTQLITEDETVGKWITRKFSTALSQPEKDRMVKAVDAVIRRVKLAREEANSADAVKVSGLGEALLSEVFGTS